MKNEANGQPSPCFPVSLSEQTMSYDIVQEAVLSLWQVVNGLSSIQPPRRDRYRVTIFGSARITRDSPLYQDVRRLASELTTLGCDIVTGGGPGLMEAANEGSVLADPMTGQNPLVFAWIWGLNRRLIPLSKRCFSTRLFSHACTISFWFPMRLW